MSDVAEGVPSLTRVRQVPSRPALVFIDPAAGSALGIGNRSEADSAVERMPHLSAIPEAHLISWLRHSLGRGPDRVGYDLHEAARSARKWISSPPSTSEVTLARAGTGEPHLRVTMSGAEVPCIEGHDSAAATTLGTDEIAIPEEGLSVSSFNTPGETKSNLLDGNPHTYWHLKFPRDPSPGYVQIDLGGPHVVSVLSVLPRSDAVEQMWDKAGAVWLGSEDAKAWQSIANLTVDRAHLRSEQWIEFVLPSAPARRFYRLQFVDLSFLSLAGLKIFRDRDGQAASAPNIVSLPPSESTTACEARLVLGREAAGAFRGDPATSELGDSMAGAVTQHLCLNGRSAEALAFLSGISAGARSRFVEMLLHAVQIKVRGAQLPPYLDQLLGADLNYFADKFCEKPFVDFEVTPTGSTFICCPSHLPQPTGNVRHTKGDKILNSDWAVAIRESILDGKFTYCDWTRCPSVMNDWLPDRDELADPDMRHHVGASDPFIVAPRHVRLSYDSTCNLFCPSCRTHKIAVKGEEFDEVMRITEEVVKPVLRGARTAMMNGYGDIFASRSCRRLLEVVNEKDYPHLKFDFITNGVLLTEKEWAKFPNVHGMVDSIRVSIDAATKPTYDLVRLGGDFERLSSNLEFMAGLRRSGTIQKFMISMVVQRENFREMAEFLDWGVRLGCDWVVFEVLQDWNVLGKEGFQARAVHLPDHPLHEEFRKAAAGIVESRDKRWKEKTPPFVTADFGAL